MDFSNKNIIITPVSNGWVVEMPRKENLPPIMGEVKDFIIGLKEDKGDLSSIMRQSGISEPKDTEVKREQHVHVFIRFADVLSFLKTQITE